MKKFTIAIPTFNQHDRLLRQLEIIMPQLTHDVECLIIDNNSTTPVYTFLSSFPFILEKVRIIRNESSIAALEKLKKRTSKSNTFIIKKFFFKNSPHHKVKNKTTII